MTKKIKLKQKILKVSPFFFAVLAEPKFLSKKIWMRKLPATQSDVFL